MVKKIGKLMIKTRSRKEYALFSWFSPDVLMVIKTGSRKNVPGFHQNFY